MKRSYTEFLQDILDAITEIGLFVNGVSYEAFESNRRTKTDCRDTRSRPISHI